MTDHLPAPFIPAHVDLTGLSYMPLHVRQLRDSRFAASADPEHFMVGVLLWCASWHQVPAGSLPDDDIELAALAGFGRVIKEWRRVREGALYGWRKCSDGRLYHEVICGRAADSFNSKMKAEWQRECDRIRKENGKRKQNNEKQAPLPPEPEPISVNIPEEFQQTDDNIPQDEIRKGDLFPTENESHSVGNPAENALKVSKGKKERTIAKAIDAEGVAGVVQMPPVPTIWGKPLTYLIAATGKSDQQCRQILGRWRKAYSDEAIIDAVTRAQLAQAVEPVSFITKCLSAGGPEPPKVDLNRHRFGGL